MKNIVSIIILLFYIYPSFAKQTINKPNINKKIPIYKDRKNPLKKKLHHINTYSNMNKNLINALSDIEDFYKKKNITKAIDYYAKINQQIFMIIRHYVHDYYFNYQYDKTLKLCYELIEKYPTINYELLDDLIIRCYAKKRNWNKVNSLFKIYKKRHKKLNKKVPSFICLELADIYKNNGKIKEAKKLYKYIIDNHPIDMTKYVKANHPMAESKEAYIKHHHYTKAKLKLKKLEKK